MKKKKLKLKWFYEINTLGKKKMEVVGRREKEKEKLYGMVDCKKKIKKKKKKHDRGILLVISK